MEAFGKLIRGWFGKVLLGLVSIILVATSMVGYNSSTNDPDVAQTVNGDKISNKDVDELVKKYQEQYLPAVNGDATLLNTAFIRQTTIDSLVSRTLLSQQAEQLGIGLSDAQLEKMIAQQPSLQTDGKFSNTLYENYLRSVGLTTAELLENLRKDHSLKMLVSSVANTAVVSQLDLQQVARLQAEQRQLHLSSIKLDSFKLKQTASNAEINQYYNAHKAEFSQVAKVDVDYVVLNAAQVQNNIAPTTDAELQQAYAKFVDAQKANSSRNVKHILIALDGRNDAQALQRANEVYAKIQAGLSFADAAKQFSDDTSSKQQGGVLAGYSKGVFSDSFDNAVAGLASNTVSKPVKTQYGYHLISTDSPQVNVPSFEQQKPTLLAELQKTKSTNALSDTVNQLNDLVVNNDSLQPVTETVKATKIVSINGLTQSMQHPYLSDANVKAKLFGDDVKNGDRNVSSAIQLANGETIWVKVRQYHAAGVPALASIRATIATKVIEDKAFKAAQATVKALLQAFKTQPAATVRAQFPTYNFEDAGTFSRSQGLKRDIERAAFSLPEPKQGMWSATTTHLPNELVVVAVSKVSIDASNMQPQQLQQLAQLYQQSRGQQELEDYSQYLKSLAKIK